MRAESLSNKISNRATTVAEILHRAAIKARLAVRKMEDGRTSTVATTAERQADLARFYDRYENLVETLCDAAQYGPTSNLEARYAEHRGWMERAYPSVSPFVTSYVRDIEAEDPFQELVSADSLADFLRTDDGQMIHRITTTREALTLYGEHLRQLSAKAS